VSPNERREDKEGEEGGWKDFRIILLRSVYF
jgi:hypothetical protein